jgi:hypothetical protein
VRLSWAACFSPVLRHFSGAINCDLLFPYPLRHSPPQFLEIMEEDAAQQVPSLPLFLPLATPIHAPVCSPFRVCLSVLPLPAVVSLSGSSKRHTQTHTQTHQEPLIPLVTSMLESTPVKLLSSSSSKLKSGRTNPEPHP